MLAIKDNISEKSDYVDFIKKNVMTADIVIWDEVGTKGLTEFEHENIMSLVNARIDAGKTNIYTSNLNDDQLLKSVGKRLHSRISKTSYSVELKGQDKRGFKL
jgi:DNA replication protein DnaC